MDALAGTGISAADSPSITSIRREDASVVDGTKSQQSRQKLADSFDEFMLLLTTQLQNQDPTEPLDTNQFTQQLVAFTGVEQAVQTNDNLEQLIALNSSTKTDSAVNYIGRYVETDGNQGFLQDGQSAFSYDLPAGTATASITIMDMTGRPVHTQTVEGREGNYSYNWDGVNSFNGTDMPNGIYQFGLTVRDIKGNTIDATTYTAGVVTSVDLTGDKPVMKLGGKLDVDADKITSVIGIFG